MDSNLLSDSAKRGFRALIVQLIIDGQAEHALELLAKHYRVDSPRLEVGLPKKHRKDVLGCYTAKNRTIHVLNSDIVKESFVILHEFYHHLRTSREMKHKGTEKYANMFAREFIEAYKSINRHEVSNCRNG